MLCYIRYFGCETVDGLPGAKKGIAPLLLEH